MIRKTQSFIEYAALIAVVAASLLAMKNYVFRAVNARINHIKEDLNDSQYGIR